VLFGIHLKQGNRNRIAGNRVTGKPRSRGHARRRPAPVEQPHNRIEGNASAALRDLTFANSPDNRIAGNRFTDGRYGMHVIFSPRLLVENNRLSDTDTGIAVLYSPDLVLRGNTVAHALDGGGAGIVFKESGTTRWSRATRCCTARPASPPMRRSTEAASSRCATTASPTTSSACISTARRAATAFQDNRFENNLTTGGHQRRRRRRAPTCGAATTWSDYQGFDRDGDGIGDTPHEIWLYSRPHLDGNAAAKFFATRRRWNCSTSSNASPPSPRRISLRDPAPRMK
jgi:nitrous oxidase accessory protein